MKTPQIIFLLLTLFSSIHALTIPTSYEEASHLFKRKGGGGGGGRGGGGGLGGGRTSSSGSGSRGSSSSGARGGVGPQPRTYAGGSYYGGGAARPYPAGRALGGRAPLLLPAAGVGFLGAGALAYGAYYYYPYNAYWTYRNESTGDNETHPVSCYCGRYVQCACEPRNETDYVQSVANNQSLARVADVNGTETLLVNGSLPNDTAVAENAAAALSSGLGQYGGWAIIGGAVAWGVLLV